MQPGLTISREIPAFPAKEGNTGKYVGNLGEYLNTDIDIIHKFVMKNN